MAAYTTPYEYEMMEQWEKEQGAKKAAEDKAAPEKPQTERFIAVPVEVSDYIAEQAARTGQTESEFVAQVMRFHRKLKAARDKSV